LKQHVAAVNMLDGLFADNAYYKKAPQKSEKKYACPGSPHLQATCGRRQHA